ncbi:MAG: D-alanine--D-alanine ligase [Cyanobacteria bacterium HKST-UBA04]|nr:D-alanine--D-alanine ligase [Cyanobacteria bacterium HKST-UBA04]
MTVSASVSMPFQPHPPAFALTPATRIAVLCGGMSSEREVSLRSGNNCLAALHRLGYTQARLIDMTADVATQLKDAQIELVYLALHGTYGEDGSIQGLLDIMGLPYTGNGVMASALTMDKVMTKRLLAQAGLPVLETAVVDAAAPMTATVKQVGALGFPVMVKPFAEGSSVGMSKVDKACDLPAAIETALSHSPYVMVEPFVSGPSLTVGVLDQMEAGQTVATPILELRTKTGWYDYEAKYTPGLTEFILPAELPEGLTRHIQAKSIEAHRACNCYGVSRVDWVVAEPVSDDSRVAILEINTIPGMTDLSDLPAQCAAMGMDYDTLVQTLLMSAVYKPVNVSRQAVSHA